MFVRPAYVTLLPSPKIVLLRVMLASVVAELYPAKSYPGGSLNCCQAHWDVPVMAICNRGLDFPAWWTCQGNMANPTTNDGTAVVTSSCRLASISARLVITGAQETSEATIS
jgi:hypothetical protein